MGISEIFVIFIVALLVFGPDKLPELARQLGKLMADMKHLSDGVRREFYNAVYVPPAENSAPSKRNLIAAPNQVPENQQAKTAPEAEPAAAQDTFAPQAAASEAPAEPPTKDETSG